MVRLRPTWIAAAAGLSCLPDVDLVTPPAAEACGDGVVELSLGEECDPGEAGAPGCSAGCRVACDGGVVDPFTQHCYFASTPTNAFLTARQACRSAGAHLVRFGSKTEVLFVAATMDGGAAWLDLEREAADAGPPVFRTEDNAEPGWRGGLLPAFACTGCYASVVGAAAQFPAVDGGDGPAVVFAPAVQSTWFAAPYDLGALALPVVCEREPAGRAARLCDAGRCFELAPTWTAKTYVLSTVPASYSGAQAACAGLGGTLAVLGSPEERGELVRAIRDVAKDVWIGLSAAAPDAWTWADGRPAASKAYADPWAGGEPAKGATGAAHLVVDDAAYDTGLARVGAPADARAFVCEAPLP